MAEGGVIMESEQATVGEDTTTGGVQAQANRVRRHRPSGAPKSAVHVQDGSLRAAVSFLRPFLHHFSFTPSHVIPGLRETIPAVDRDKVLTIIRLERDQDLPKATAELLDCLLSPDGDHPPDALLNFLHALRSGTSEHSHVHNMLCVSSVYLPVHRHLVNAMARKLQDGTLHMDILLHLLKELKLLQPQRATQILNMARTSGNNEECAGVASFLLACLYSNQAEILSEMHGASRQQGHNEGGGSAIGGLANLHNGSSGSPSETGQGFDVANRTGPEVGIDAITQIIEDSLRGSDNRTTSPHPRRHESHDHGSLDERSTAAQNGVPATGNDVSSSTDHPQTDPASPERCEHGVLTWLLQGGGVWTVVLEQVLDRASSEQGGVWSSVLDHTHDAALWDATSELIQRAVEPEGSEAQAVNDDDEDEGSVTSSGDSMDTVRPSAIPAEPKASLDGLVGNLNHTKQERVKQYVQNHKMHVNITADGDMDGDLDEVASIVSIETNSRQRERRAELEGVVCGVLREEEAQRLKEGPIKLRPYQDELLESARRGNNVLIWLPTGTGKTYIVLKYAEEHLKSSPNTRVGFVVPKVRLARQQYERFQAYLPQFNPHLKTGETSGSTVNKQPLSDVLQTSRVVVMTGQCLVAAVDKAKVTLDQFTLLVLDECHHTRGGHPLRTIMNQYMELKFTPRDERVTLPQIIGLTASPGVGKARGKDPGEAEKYLRQLCARLDVSHICSVRKHKADLQQYVNEPLQEVRECEKRKVDKLKERLESLMEVIEKRMFSDDDVERYLNQLHKQKGGLSPERLLRQLEAPVTQRGEEQYTQWFSNAEKALQDVNHQKAFYVLTAHIDMLKRCQRCLILNEDCDSLDALEFLKEDVQIMHSEKPSVTQVDEELFLLFERYTDYTSNLDMPSLQDECARRECQNPKLKHLEEFILNATRDNHESSKQTAPAELEQRPLANHVEDEAGDESSETDGLEAASSVDMSEWSDVASVTSSEFHHLDEKVRGMVFVRTLDLSKALLRWMKGHPKLKWLNPGRITGVNASVSEGGMTKSEVTEVMAKFNAGVHKLIICTSAAEEGLDFKACNLVIRYLYEASMVSMIQTRGRAREQNSLYCVMGRQNSGSLAKERDNMQSELVMRKAVLSIQEAVDRDPQAHRHVIQTLQRENWNRRWRKDVQEAKRLQQQLPEGVYRLKCRGCRAPACTSEDIRLLRDTNRVVIGAEFSNKYDRRDPNSSQNRTYDKNIPRTGMLHCKQCGFYWGIIVRSVVDNVEFPVIPIKSFLIECSSGEIKFFEKWGMAFKVLEITDQDRLRHSDPLIGPSGRLEGEMEEEEENETSQPLNSLSNLPNHPDRLEREDEQDQQETATSRPSNGLSSLPSRPGQFERECEEGRREAATSEPSNSLSSLPDPSGRPEREGEDQQKTAALQLSSTVSG